MIVLDIECDGLLDTVSTFHCATTINPLTLEVINYVCPLQLTEAITKEGLVIGHNIIGYDLPALRILTGQDCRPRCFDTLVAARLLSPEGQHSLEVYGKRLGFHKAGYSGGWEQVSEEMKEYCHQDVMLCAVLFLELVKRLHFEEFVGIPNGDISRLQREIRSIKYA